MTLEFLAQNAMHARVVEEISKWFIGQGWVVERTVDKNGDRIEAVMASGYGSGPAVINIIDLCKIAVDAVSGER